MYLPRNLIAHLYQHLYRNHHPLSPPVLVLVALEPDALCACRILAALFKRDYIGHKIQPIAGYDDLARAGESMVAPMKKQNGGAGGLVVCLGVGGLVDLSAILGLEDEGDGNDAAGGVEVWLIDARRPWNLGNVFGGDPLNVPGAGPRTNHAAKTVEGGKIQKSYKPGHGGIIIYDDGDVEEELSKEQEAYCSLLEMGDIDFDPAELDDDDDEDAEQEPAQDGSNGRKRQSWEVEDDVMSDGNPRPRQRRRSDSETSNKTHDSQAKSLQHQEPNGHSSPRPTSAANTKTLRRKFLEVHRKHDAVLARYYAQGASYSEPISSILYSLAEDLGREDNNLLWHAIVGVTSLELYGRTMTGVGISTSLDSGGSAGWGGARGEHVRQIFRDEVRRLNPPDATEMAKESTRGESYGVIPTTAKSPNDYSIRLSPEPRFLLIRHWSLYDSMLHSPYLGSRLHIWNDQGRKRLHKLLAKMGVSLTQCKQNYTHMDMDLKRSLRQRLLTYAPQYGLDGLVPPPPSKTHGREGWGFVRSWGWKACLSAMDVGVITGAILEIGRSGVYHNETSSNGYHRNVRNGNTKSAIVDEDGRLETAEWVGRFWDAYDALDDIEALKAAIPTAQHLHRAILRTGTSTIEKRQIRHLKAFRMAVVKEGPDVQLFTHPAALTKLALWIAEAIAEQEKDQRGVVGKAGRPTPLVMAGLNEQRGVYVVVGIGGSGGVIDFTARAARKQKSEAKAKAKTVKKAERVAQREAKRMERLAAKDAQDDDDEEEEEEDDDEEDDEGDSESEDDEDDDREESGRNRFGNAFQEVVDETNARVRIDSFDHCVVEVKKDDLGSFLESLSMKAVVG